MVLLLKHPKHVRINPPGAAPAADLPLTRCRTRPNSAGCPAPTVCAQGYGVPQGAGSNSACSLCPVGTWSRSLWASPGRFTCWPCPGATTTAAPGARSSSQCSECREERGGNACAASVGALGEGVQRYSGMALLACRRRAAPAASLGHTRSTSQHATARCVVVGAAIAHFHAWP